MTHKELITKLEMAQMGSPELDADVAHAVGWWHTPEESIALMRAELGREPSDKAKSCFTIPKWFPPSTTSLDTALMLVPEGWNSEISIQSGKGGAFLQHLNLKSIFVEAKTPALALCIAALKARGMK